MKICVIFIIALLGLPSLSAIIGTDVDTAYYQSLSTSWQGSGKSMSVDTKTMLVNLAATSISASWQMWRFLSVGNGYYKISCQLYGEEKSLDVLNNKYLILKDSINVASQDWKIVKINGQWLRINNRNFPGKSIDVINDGTNNKLQVTTTGSYSGQYWKFTKIFIKVPPQQKAFELNSVNSFTMIYDDRSTGSSRDFSVWRPRLVSGFYSLGDVGMESHSAPKNTFIVKELVAGALAKPVKYNRGWQDRGSGGTFDVTFWKPVAPRGYTCLGDVAIRSYSGKPSTNQIRCVKNKYLDFVNALLVWNDKGSGASKDVSVWQGTPKNTDALYSNAFNSIIGYSYSNKIPLIKKRFVKNLVPRYGYLSDQFWLGFAKKYAPYVYMHPSQRFFPSDAQQFKDQVKIENNYMVVPLKSPSDTGPTILKGKKPSTNKVPMYAMVVRKDNGFVDIVYWFFYPYNRGKYIGPIDTVMGNHVGDWEHMTIRFRNAMPHSLYLSQHASGETFFWGDKNVQSWYTVRPIIYSALGSHGSYGYTGQHVYKSYVLFKLADKMGKGSLWSGAKNVVPFMRQDQGKYTGRLSFLNFDGRWGNPKDGCTIVGVSGQCRLNSGPTGVMAKRASNPSQSGIA